MLEPWAWNTVVSSLLTQIEKEDIRIVAYADGLLVFAEGNSRADLERKANVALGRIDRLCKHHKLDVSIGKSVMMLSKGKLNVSQPHSVKMGQRSLKRVREHLYLDVSLDDKLSFNRHANRSAAKCTNALQGL